VSNRSRASALRLDRSDPQPYWLKVLLVGEVLAFCAGMSLYLWHFLPEEGVHALDVVAWLLAIGFPIGLNLLHGDRPGDSGIRIDTIAEASWRAALATGILAGGLLAGGLALGSIDWPRPGRLLERLGLYVLWGLLQQYWLQAFALRRLLQAKLPVAGAVLLAAGVFSLLHAPNWPLVGLTFGAGLVWCGIFLKAPNLLALGVSHALLAVLTYVCLPRDWLGRLTVGAMYLREMSGQ
jgi:hypothetical protein